MSKYRTDTTEFCDRDCLVSALKEMGYATVEVHEAATNLYGFRGDVRPELANIIVRREFVGAAANDLGFAIGKDGKFRAIVSDYDRIKHNATWMERLTDAYSERTILKQAARQGLRFLGKKVEGGKTHLQFMER